MASRDLQNEVKVVASVIPILGNDDTEGTGVGVDLLGFESAVMVCEIGISGDTLSGSVKILPTLQESTDNSTFTDVAAADMIGAFTLVDDAAEDAVIQQVGYIGTKRYIRALFDFTGTHTNGCPISAVAVLGHARHLPQ